MLAWQLYDLVSVFKMSTQRAGRQHLVQGLALLPTEATPDTPPSFLCMWPSWQNTCTKIHLTSNILKEGFIECCYEVGGRALLSGRR